MFIINIDIAKNFGKDTGFGIGLALLSMIIAPLIQYAPGGLFDYLQEILKKWDEIGFSKTAKQYLTNNLNYMNDCIKNSIPDK